MKELKLSVEGKMIIDEEAFCSEPREITKLFGNGGVVLQDLIMTIIDSDTGERLVDNIDISEKIMSKLKKA